jgi:hypothetical protein
MGIFMALTTSKNHKIWRVARELQDERSGFWIDQNFLQMILLVNVIDEMDNNFFSLLDVSHYWLQHYILSYRLNVRFKNG